MKEIKFQRFSTSPRPPVATNKEGCLDDPRVFGWAPDEEQEVLLISDAAQKETLGATLQTFTQQKKLGEYGKLATKADSSAEGFLLNVQGVLVLARGVSSPNLHDCTSQVGMWDALV